MAEVGFAEVLTVIFVNNNKSYYSCSVMEEVWLSISNEVLAELKLVAFAIDQRKVRVFFPPGASVAPSVNDEGRNKRRRHALKQGISHESDSSLGAAY